RRETCVRVFGIAIVALLDASVDVSVATARERARRETSIGIVEIAIIALLVAIDVAVAAQRAGRRVQRACRGARERAAPIAERYARVTAEVNAVTGLALLDRAVPTRRVVRIVELDRGGWPSIRAAACGQHAAAGQQRQRRLRS